MEPEQEVNAAPQDILTLILGALVATKHDKTLRISAQAVETFLNLGDGSLDIARDTRDGAFVVKLSSERVEG